MVLIHSKVLSETQIYPKFVQRVLRFDLYRQKKEKLERALESKGRSILFPELLWIDLIGCQSLQKRRPSTPVPRFESLPLDAILPIYPLHPQNRRGDAKVKIRRLLSRHKRPLTLSSALQPHIQKAKLGLHLIQCRSTRIASRTNGGYDFELVATKVILACLVEVVQRLGERERVEGGKDKTSLGSQEGRFKWFGDGGQLGLGTACRGKWR